MGLFSRKRRTEAERIATFWQWWSTVRDDVAAGISAGTVHDLADTIGRQVDAVDAGLQWELAPGHGSEHALVVTAGGDPALRAVAARWLAAAPEADATWSYRSARAADPSTFQATIELDGHKLELAELRFGITADPDRRQVDVVAYHPAFADVPEAVRRQVTFLSLDWALGEDDVEIWVGPVGWVTSEPEPAQTPADLRHAVDAIADDDSWVLLRGQTRDGTPVLATAASPLRSARWPRFDLHVPVTLPYRQYNDGQLPVGGSLDALRRFEDELGAAIGGNGKLVAHESSGRRRVLHFYVDAQTNARAEIESRLGAWGEGRASADPARDPGLERVRHLAG